MEFREIKEVADIWVGEYILHEPTQQVVLLGGITTRRGTSPILKVMANGQVSQDVITNFRKIYRSEEEILRAQEHQRHRRPSRGGCGCKGKR